jgi:hypothetical protein
VYATRVKTDGEVQDPSGFAVSTGAADEVAPAVSPKSGGWRLAYQVDLGDGSAIHQRAAK